MRRRVLGVIAVGCLSALVLLGLAVAGGRTASGIEAPIIGWLAPDPRGGWARLPGLLALPVIAVAVLASLVVGMARRVVPRVAVYAALAGLTFVLSEHVVKPLVDRTYYDELTFPSGNVTAVCATALAMWLALWPVMGRPARWVTGALGASWVLAVSLAVVGAEWHTPLDDLGSVLLAVGLVAAGGAALEPVLGQWPPRRAERPSAGRGGRATRRGRRPEEHRRSPVPQYRGPGMDGSGHPAGTWQHSVKEALRPVRDGVVHALGGTVPALDATMAPGERVLTYDQLVHLLYPTLPESLRPAVDAAAAGDLADVSTIRRMLGTIEHQVAPTAFSVQLAGTDAVRCSAGGVDLYADAADAAVTPGLRSGEYEPHLTAAFERYCRPGMTVVDVGANLGYYALLAAKLVGTSGRVIALEPNSENCRLLLSSLRLNGVENVDVIPVAADVGTGWAYYSTHVGSNGGLIDGGDLLDHPGVVVPTFALDDIVKSPVGLLKMDVEGAEGRVARGARRIITQDRPVVTTELKEEMLRRVSGTTVAEYLGWFEGLGYRPALLEKGSPEERPYASAAALLADIAETDELRDVLLVPAIA